MRNKLGYATIIGPGQHKEYDTCTCRHCNRIWTIQSTEKGQAHPGGWCRFCMKPICPKCAGKACFPFEKKLALYERNQNLFKEMGLAL